MAPTTSIPDPPNDCRWTISRLLELPCEMLSGIIDFLEPCDLLALLRAFPSMVGYIPPLHFTRTNDNGISILHVLAATDHKTKLLDAILLEIAVDANSMSEGINNPLSYAIFHKNEKATEALLKRKDVDANSWCPLLGDQTPLMYAIHKEEKGLINLLLDREGVNVAQPNQWGRTPLSFAAEKGDVVLTKRLLRHYTNASHVDGQGRAAISYAATSGSKEVVELLLSQHGVNADQADGAGRTPLSYAAQAGSKEVVEFLLSQPGVNPDQTGEVGITPLWFAAVAGRKEVIELLLSQPGVNLGQADDRSRALLLYAAAAGSKVAVELLLSQPGASAALIGRGGRTPLSYAAQAGSKEAVEFLLSQPGVNPDQADESGRTPLSYAASAGSKEVVELLLSQHGANADQKDNNERRPLSYAVEAQHEEVVRLLTRPDLYPGGEDDYCQEPLRSFAVRKGNEEIVKLLLPRPNVDAETRTSSNRLALFEAAAKGSTAVVKLLLSQPDVHADEGDDEGRTPLSYAAERGDESVARLLLDEFSVSAHSRCHRGKSPLRYAAESGKADVIRLLLNHDREADLGYDVSMSLVALAQHHPKTLVPELVHHRDTDVNYGGDRGETALFRASLSGSTPLVELLLSHPNINIDKGSGCGTTPLLAAIVGNHEDTALLLLKHGADHETVLTDPRSSYKITPLTAAIYRQQERVVEQLLHHGVSMEIEDPYDNLPLVIAAQNPRPRCVRLLLDYYDGEKNNATSDFCLALHYAVTQLRPEAVKMLLDRLNGRVPKPFGPLLEELPMLSYVLKNQFFEMLDDEAEPQWEGDWHRISERNHELIVKAMLGIRDDELANMDKESPFYIELRCQVFVAQMLLDRADAGADWSCYHFPWPESRGAFAKYEGIVKKLLALRDNQTAQLRQDNLTPLRWATADPEVESYFNIVWYLLHAPEPAVNVVSKDGLTELLYAIGAGRHVDMTWLLEM